MTINCNGQLIDLKIPKVMGILNLTPDSFYDGGKYRDMDALLRQVERMLVEGATFIDLGAYSSRPGATAISIGEECSRLMPVVATLLKEFPEILLSIDTFRAAVAQEAIEAGAAMVNDISAGRLDVDMMPTVGRLQVPYIMMHMRGNPQTMTSMTTYVDVVREVLIYFSESVEMARASSINDLILDPGFGFAKTIEQNFELLHRFEIFNIAQLPLLAGLSRKSSIYKSLEGTAAEALNGTTVLHTIALQKGASILRVHDVRQAIEAIKLVGLTMGSSTDLS